MPPTDNQTPTLPATVPLTARIKPQHRVLGVRVVAFLCGGGVNFAVNGGTFWLLTRLAHLPKNTAYVLQYATVDCAKKLLLFEKTALYSAENTMVNGRVTGLTPASQKGSVKPGSIGESVYKYVCVDPTTLPKSEQ